MASSGRLCAACNESGRVSRKPRPSENVIVRSFKRSAMRSSRMQREILSSFFLGASCKLQRKLSTPVHFTMRERYWVWRQVMRLFVLGCISLVRAWPTVGKVPSRTLHRGYCNAFFSSRVALCFTLVGRRRRFIYHSKYD